VQYHEGTQFHPRNVYIYLPTVEYGEREIDFKTGSGRQPAGDRLSAASLGFGYGATERWFYRSVLKVRKNKVATAPGLTRWNGKTSFSLRRPASTLSMWA
jgi:hypothetical protein